MDAETMSFLRTVTEVFDTPAPVVEIGSFQIEQGVFGDLRPHYPKPYIGLDAAVGPGVDLVGNVHCLPLGDMKAGTIVTAATLEHVAKPIVAVDEMCRALRPSGVLIMTSVFCFPIHAYPSDYWRFTPECFNMLMQSFRHRIICALGRPRSPIWVMGIGFKTDDDEDPIIYESRSSQLHEAYLQKLAELVAVSAKTRFIGTAMRQPILRRFRTPTLADMGLAVRRGMELSTAVYHANSKSRELRKRIA